MKLTLVLITLLTLVLTPPVVPAANAQNEPAAGRRPSHGQSSGPATAADSSLPVVSQTGLLPVYGVDFRFDPTWVDAAQFPSRSAEHPNFGVNAAFQNAWEAMKPGGFNALRIALDVRDSNKAANRLGNLCVWAKNNNVKLLPILVGAPVGADGGQPLGTGYPADVTAFIHEVIAALRSTGQNLPDYTQILAYQLESEFNHANLHGAMPPPSMPTRLLEAARALRQTEQEALQGTGMGATPVMVDVSFDYELIQIGPIAGSLPGKDAYEKAYAALKPRLAAFVGSADIDMIGVDWFADSLSVGDVAKFPALLKSLEADAAGKQVVLTTGFSIGSRPVDEQKQFYAAAIKSLAGYRVQEGADSSFVGLFFHEAPPSPKSAVTTASDPNPAPPSGSQAAASPIAPSQSAGSPNTPGPGAVADTVLKDKLQQGFASLLDSLFARLANLISGNTGGGRNGISGGNSGTPDTPGGNISSGNQGNSLSSGQDSSLSNGSMTNNSATNNNAGDVTASNLGGGLGSRTAQSTRSGLVRTQSTPPSSRAVSAIPRSEVRSLPARTGSFALILTAPDKPVIGAETRNAVRSISADKRATASVSKPSIRAIRPVPSTPKRSISENSTDSTASSEHPTGASPRPVVKTGSDKVKTKSTTAERSRKGDRTKASRHEEKTSDTFLPPPF